MLTRRRGMGIIEEDDEHDTYGYDHKSLKAGFMFHTFHSEDLETGI
jgi:hypothetical protein